MLEDDDARLLKVAHGVPSGLGVEEVVVRQRLALQLLGTHERGGGGGETGEVVGEAVHGGRLVRVLAVAQVLGLLELEGERRRRLELLGSGRSGNRAALELRHHPVGDRRVICRGGGVDLRLQGAAQTERGGAVVGAHLGEDGLVVGGVTHHGHRIGVLGGGAQHGGAADVDVLDGVDEGDVGLGHGLLELVEVHHDHVDHADAVLSGLGHVLL